MTRKGWSVVLLFCLALFGGISAGYFTASRSEITDTVIAEDIEKPQLSAEEETFIVPEESEKEVAGTERYMVTLSDSRLFIYKISADGSMQLIEDKEIDSASLRREDFTALFKGITFDTLTEARELLEDYVN